MRSWEYFHSHDLAEVSLQKISISFASADGIFFESNTNPAFEINPDENKTKGFLYTP